MRRGTLRRGAPGIRLVLLVLGLVVAVPCGAPMLSVSANAQTQSPDEQLARKYAPIVYVQEQPGACSTTGEAYLPVPVETVFDDPEVTLRRIAAAGESSDPIVTTAPNAASLAGLDKHHYLDFPGDSRNPGCDYEEWLRRKVEENGIQPLLYARIATEPRRPGELALQYWHYWVYNHFNNTHESDWEMVQLTFAADTAEEALGQEPSAVTFAQHGGGERADWTDDKLRREGDRVVVYPAAGSHASYYDDALWIGWGEQGAGFGCDDIREPLVRLEPTIALIPATVAPGSGFEWLLFEGHWGQRESWEFNGPRGPNHGPKWIHPIGWTDRVRESSLPIPAYGTVGPGSAGVFCSISGTTGAIFTLFPVHPRLTGAVSAAFVLVPLVLVLLGWRYVVRAVKLYATHPAVFLPTSALMLVVARIGAVADDLIDRFVFRGDGGEAPGFSEMFGTGLGIGVQNIQHLLTFSLVAPAVVYATYGVESGERARFRRSWSVAVRRFPRTLGAVYLTLLLTGVMAATVVLLPVAIYKGVQWLYTPHAVMIQGASWRGARHVSRRAVKGHWWRTLGFGASIVLFSGVPGPLVGVALLVLVDASMDVANLASTVVYLVAYPIAVIASTLYYLTISGLAPKVAEPAEAAALSAGTPAATAARA